jgi:hypothetical protein
MYFSNIIATLYLLLIKKLFSSIDLSFRSKQEDLKLEELVNLRLIIG